jgi:alpha-tubulin suppressor-like RCC1 family protein
VYTKQDYVDIEADWTFCGLTSAGVVECAPLDVSGKPPPPSPIPDPPAGTVAEIAVGRSFRYGADLQCLRLAGQPLSAAVYCWGDNIAGGLGAGGPDQFPAPETLPSLPPVATVRASQYATSVVLQDGSARVWGTARGFFAGTVPAPPATGMFGTDNAAVRANDPYNSGYVLKQTGALQYREEGFLVPNGRLAGSGFSDFDDVLHFSAWDIGLRSGGTVAVYGHLAQSNLTGIFGNGTTLGSAGQTVTVPGLPMVQQIAAYGPDDGLSPSHACAIQTGGALSCWGENYWGAIGNGETSDSPVTTPTQVTIPGGEPVISVAAGRGYTCAAVQSGKVYCWGRVGSGQLGVDVFADQPLPVEVTGVTGAVGVTARSGHTCAWLADETAMCWGENSVGQLGIGNFEDRSTPAAVPGLSGVVEVSAGVEHTCARHAGGALSCWGSAYWGQIGNGVDGQFPSPQRVQGL